MSETRYEEIFEVPMQIQKLEPGTAVSMYPCENCKCVWRFEGVQFRHDLMNKTGPALRLACLTKLIECEDCGGFGNRYCTADPTSYVVAPRTRLIGTPDEVEDHQASLRARQRRVLAGERELDSLAKPVAKQPKLLTRSASIIKSTEDAARKWALHQLESEHAQFNQNCLHLDPTKCDCFPF